MLSKKIVRFLKSGFLVISIGFSMGISGCKGNTEEPVSSEPIEIVSEKGMDDNFINIPIDIYAEATTKNKLKDMETVRKVVERFGRAKTIAVDIFGIKRNFVHIVINSRKSEVTAFLRSFPQYPQSLLLLLPYFILYILIVQTERTIFV